ncbi:TPA: DUF2283 domain-containing protein [Candidatus Daviesbacteria bacterium]|nr:MAG: hypothetical protein A3D02_03205 [Candidatus Daviesbacteria bacterium RIFCSPHIGHO2_02_FULL_39_41]OGE45776.1 MAG: hypothetical protein A3E67_03400 [Candidatus Daviesbacteria bacterium RIFCSPHIGHO2_12_FULL_38_25]OGE68991.1 MAG: hypothetical protein A3H81_03510 [Candidatus Daviesbacteria bacterium RIFCSPLOWO2_02_FULL_38_18]HBQ51039.1 DUF2283 domain-containing protein [Candidatus Daviesbacteria bacterium]HCB23168.1 DUF2283 domain-containing protein [Candidatus Daviesbacteria bacterium]
MKIQYDPKVDAVYIELAKGTYEVSREISDSVVVDEDKNGKILGVEVLDVSRVLGPKFRANTQRPSRFSNTGAVLHRISK